MFKLLVYIYTQGINMKKLSNEVIQEVLRLNNTLTSPSIISKQLKICRKSVYNILEKNGIKINGIERFNNHRKYDIDLTYFEKIDKPEKAYFLGWIYSDGCLDEKSKLFRISIQEKDKDILEKLMRLISNNAPIKFRKRNNNYDNCLRQDLVILQIKRIKIYNDLLKLGLYPNKSETLPFPTFSQVPEKFVFHFIRGYFDGDGCISVKHRENLVPLFSAGMVCSKSFAKTLMEILRNYKIKSCITKKSTTDKVVDLRIPNNTDCINFLEKMYDDRGNLFLRRKYDKYVKILQEYINAQSKINLRTIEIFKSGDIMKKHLNEDIDYDNKWTIDHRIY
jgi:hypothetical protein